MTPGETPGGTPPPQAAGTAVVESVEVRLLESFPVQVQVVAKGYLPDGCTQIGEITQTREGNTFEITITTTRPADAACVQVIQPFEQVIPLDANGLLRGSYAVNVNGVSQTFALQADNILTPQP